MSAYGFGQLFGYATMAAIVIAVIVWAVRNSAKK